MGLCPSTLGKRSFINQEVSLEQSIENRAELSGTPMSERSKEAEFNSYLEFNDAGVKMARQWYERVIALSAENRDLKKRTEQLTKDNQSLRQRQVEENSSRFEITFEKE